VRKLVYWETVLDMGLDTGRRWLKRVMSTVLTVSTVLMVNTDLW